MSYDDWLKRAYLCVKEERKLMDSYNKVMCSDIEINLSRSREHQIFAYMKTKAQISCAVTAQLICAFVFTAWIVQLLFFLNPKFQASSLLL